MEKKTLTPEELNKATKELLRLTKKAQKALEGKETIEKPIMKPTLQALLIAPDQKMRDDIIWERKKITIREGHRDYKPGPVMLCCHLEPWAVMAEIVIVEHCLFKEITQAEYHADGFESQEDLLKGLQKYYPNMTSDSPVTVIRWHKVKGFLVDHRIELKRIEEATAEARKEAMANCKLSEK